MSSGLLYFLVATLGITLGIDAPFFLLFQASHHVRLSVYTAYDRELQVNYSIIIS